MSDKTPIEELKEVMIENIIYLPRIRSKVDELLDKEKALQAKHKEDIKQAYTQGLKDWGEALVTIEEQAEQYYKENYE